MATFDIGTVERACVVDVTSRVRAEVAASGVSGGICVVGSPHTTVGIIVNEPDSDLFGDLLNLVENAAPRDGWYRHPDNSDSHLKALLLGGSVVLPVVDGDLDLGIWQAVLLCEFDGPRSRTVRVDLVGD